MSADEHDDAWTLIDPALARAAENDDDGHGSSWPDDEDWDSEAPGLDDEDWGL